MARQFASASTPTNLINGHNETHRSVVALETAVPHYDGAEWSTGGVEQVLASSYSSPTTLTDAVNVLNAAKALYNLHLGYHNSGNGKKIYAHKAVDAANVVSTADMSSGSTLDAALLASIIALATEARTDYEAHRVNASYHAAADTTYILGGSPTITTWTELASELNNLKAQYNGHIAFSSGGSPHSNPDGTNAVTAPNASATDPDSCLTLANQIKSKYNSHRTQATVHVANDTTNIISGSDAAYPATLFTLAIELKGDYNTHRASTTYHQTADSTNTISSSDPTTVASLITIAAEFFTDLDAHFRYAPTTQAFRSV